MKKGFTLLELIIVIIIIGVLATLGFTQYTKMIERGRTAEAKAVLGTLRSAEVSYNLEHGGTVYATLSDLPVSAPTVAPACTATTHYFGYGCASADGTCTAIRCTSGGKTPYGPAYTITLTPDGAWGGTGGYY